MTSVEIKSTLKQSLIPQWKLAKKLGVSENTVNRWLRDDLTEEKEKMILVAIEDLKKGG